MQQFETARFNSYSFYEVMKEFGGVDKKNYN